MEPREPAFEDQLYDEFPGGAEEKFGPSEGYNTWVRVNDERLFTAEAREIPAIRAFLDAPFDVTFAQFKSSHRESEYFIHKPHLAMTRRVGGIDGEVRGVSADEPRTPIATLVLNHERTLAYHITRSIAVSGDGLVGQMLVKEEAP